MEVKLLVFKVKQDKKELFLSWCHELMTTEKDEALRSLRQEDTKRETCKAFSIGEDLYVVGQQIIGDHPNGSPEVLTVDIKHKEILHTCLEMIPTEVLYDFRNS